MADNRIQVKRTSTSGRTPNTTNSGNSQYIAAGELALNMADGILYSSNGTVVIPVGANNVDLNVSNTLTVKAVSANGGNGSSGQVLTSNGTATYWSTVSATVNTAAQYTWTNTHTFTNTVTINNDKSLRFQTVNTSAFASFIQQSDDNFVFYTTNASYGQRAVWSIFANTNSSEFSFSTPVRFNANVTVLTANGSAGATNQVLTSNGSTVYWSSPGAASVNTSAQYTWSNTHTFQANISFTGNNINLVTNTGSIMFAGASDTNWRIGRNTGGTTKFFYTNNSLDFIAANSNLEGIAFGFTGDSYLETGYAGTFTRNPVYIGSATTNSIVNATAFTVRSNSTVNSVLTATTLTFANTTATPFVASVTGLYHTGTMNAASFTTSGFNANTIGVYPTTNTVGQNLGNTISRWAFFANTIDATGAASITNTLAAGNTTVTGFVNASVSVNSALFTTAGLIANATGIYPSSNTIELGNTTSRWSIYSSGAVISGLTIISTVAANLQVTSQSTGSILLGGPTQTGSILLGQSTANQTVSIANGATISGNVKTISIGENGAAGSQTNITVGSSASNTLLTVNANNTTFSGSVNVVTSVNSASLTVGTSFVANTLGVYHTGTVNAASHTIGTTWIANTLGVYHTGTVNASTLSVGSNFIANSQTITIGSSVSLNANGSTGTSGQVLTSNGSAIYWSTPTGGGGGVSLAEVRKSVSLRI